MTWFILLVPLTLLLLGFPIFVILIASSACLLMFFMNVPYAVAHQTLFGAID
jgi:C4-dicarboxylate transporter DctM subunit